jgi:hypothetical protein
MAKLSPEVVSESGRVLRPKIAPIDRCLCCFTVALFYYGLVILAHSLPSVLRIG